MAGVRLAEAPVRLMTRLLAALKADPGVRRQAAAPWVGALRRLQLVPMNKKIKLIAWPEPVNGVCLQAAVLAGAPATGLNVRLIPQRNARLAAVSGARIRRT